MPLNIRNEAVKQLAGALAAKPAINKTEAVAQALRNELQRVAETTPLQARLRPTWGSSHVAPGDGAAGGQGLLR